ncbi:MULTISPECIES: hypothetical protein [Fischerella]|uniref:hypothetical protein n=1 Tax=Fischerella sp. FACHB-380 TaxID=2692799 RepID=UPI000303559F|nr:MULTISPECIES: hypothetical protein [Fischerella]
MYRYYGDEVMMHLEFIRVNGAAIPATFKLRIRKIIVFLNAEGRGVSAKGRRVFL